MAALLSRLGVFAARRPWAVVIAWGLLLTLTVGTFLGLGGQLKNSFDIPGTASGEVVDQLAENLPEMAGGTGAVVFRTEDASAFTTPQREAISALSESAERLDGVEAVVDPFETTSDRERQMDELDAVVVELDQGRSQLAQAQEQREAEQQQLNDAREQLEAAQIPTDSTEWVSLRSQQEQLDQQLESFAEQAADLRGAAERTALARELLDHAEGISVLSEDESTAIVNISYTASRLDLSDEVKEATVEHFQEAEISGVTVDFSAEISQGGVELFGPAEMIGLGIAAVVLVVVLGSLVAAALPLVTALMGVAIGVSLSLSFSSAVDMASVTPVLGVMLGLAVGIDYSLFIINRHRKQLLVGTPVQQSIGLATGTSGTAVVFAGTTVIIALLALNVTGVPFLGLMGTVGAVCVAIAVLVSITLAPAILGLLGTRLLGRRTREKAARKPSRERNTRPMSTLRAVFTALAAAAVLLVLAMPAADMRLGLPDSSGDPHDSTSYRSYTVIDEEFGAGANSPLLVVAETDSGGVVDDDDLLQTQVDVVSMIAEIENVAAVAPVAVSDDSALLVFQVKPEHGPNSASTAQLVEDIRALPAVNGDPRLGVAGQAAINIDISDRIGSVLPLYLVVVVSLALLIMILVFRSVLVPLIATGGFVLSLFATFGLIVAVFQYGWGAELIGIHNTGPVLSFLPVLLVGILFGLAMDYQLFLTSGMREAFARGVPPQAAVAKGVTAAQSVVIAAALIMMAVFGGFIFADATIVRSIGFGLAFGVLIDAILVRLLLMPALMHLLGKAAWWVPKWLDRVLPDVDIEGSALARPGGDRDGSGIR